MIHGDAKAGSLSISGTIWQDANLDGVRQPDERGVRIMNVSLFKDGVEVSGIQPEDQGRYSFAGLESGPYIVRLAQAPDSFFWTYPNRRSTGPYETTVNLTDASISTVDFGLGSLEALPHFFGYAWIDGQPLIGGDVRAYINGNDCTAGARELFRDILAPSIWQLSVLSSAYRAGCGVSGEPISFTINGRAAILTLNQVTEEVPAWGPDQASHPRYQLIAGPPFSTFEAFAIAVDVDGDRRPDSVPGAVIEAFVGEVRCGRLVMLDFSLQYISVASSRLQPGCGVPGSPITFTLSGVPVKSLITHGRSAENEPWLEGIRGDGLILNAPVVPLRPPNTGDAGMR